MSWLRSAIKEVAKAAEVGGKNLGPNLTKTVRNYAGTVYQQAGHAVAGGAKIVQDRLSGRNLNNFKHAVKRLEEVALVTRGQERKQALARWLAALKDIDRDSSKKKDTNQPDGSASPRTPLDEDNGLSPRRASMVFFYDPDMGGEPLNFRDVFLRSHALENIVTSLILEAPDEDEVSMLLEIFGLCLTGRQELHNAIISSIQDLSQSLLAYTEEVLVKKEELFQMARDAVSGLKLNSELERLDDEILALKNQISDKQTALEANYERSSSEISTTNAPGAVFQMRPDLAEEIIQLHVNMRNSLQRRALMVNGGDTPKEHAKKLQKLQEASACLFSSSEELKTQILENRQQKEDAMNYRVAKAIEVTEVEKAVAGEVRDLEKRKKELEAELKAVKEALATATIRHINTQEEKEQFDEASSNIVAHLSIKEEELSRSVGARKAEASAVGIWLNFLEDTWVLQLASVENSVKDTEAALEESKNQFVQVATMNLSYHQEELDLYFRRLQFCGEELESLRKKKENAATLGMESVIKDMVGVMRKTQENYLEAELQVEKTLKIVADLEEEVVAYQNTNREITEAEIKLGQQFEATNKLRYEFECRQRPEIEGAEDAKPAEEKPKKLGGRKKLAGRLTALKVDALRNRSAQSEPVSVDTTQVPIVSNLVAADDEAKSPSDDFPSHEDGNMTSESGDLISHGETEGWEFDELEEDLDPKAKDT